MQAIILAAGFGKRLQPLTEVTPKPLLQIQGKALIQYNLELLQKYNITDVIITLHYKADMIKAFCGDGSKFGLKIKYSEERHILETGGGVKLASQYLNNDDNFLVINSDIIIDVDLQKLMDFHINNNGLATMVVRAREVDSAYSIIKVRQNQVVNIKNFLEGNTIGEDYIYTGVQVLNKNFLNYLQLQKGSIIETGYRQALLAKQNILAFRQTGFWADLGTTSDYKKYNNTYENNVNR